MYLIYQADPTGLSNEPSEDKITIQYITVVLSPLLSFVIVSLLSIQGFVTSKSKDVCHHSFSWMVEQKS